MHPQIPEWTPSFQIKPIKQEINQDLQLREDSYEFRNNRLIVNKNVGGKKRYDRLKVA